MLDSGLVFSSSVVSGGGGGGGGVPTSLPLGIPVTGGTVGDILIVGPGGFLSQTASPPQIGTANTVAFFDGGGVLNSDIAFSFNDTTKNLDLTGSYLFPAIQTLQFSQGNSIFTNPVIAMRQQYGGVYDTLLTVGDSQGIYSGTPYGFRALLHDIGGNIRNYIEISADYTALGCTDFANNIVQSFSTNMGNGLMTMAMGQGATQYDITMGLTHGMIATAPAAGGNHIKWKLGSDTGNPCFSVHQDDANNLNVMAFGDTSGVLGGPNSFFLRFPDITNNLNSLMLMNSSDWEVESSNGATGEQVSVQINSTSGSSFSAMSQYNGTVIRRILIDGTAIKIGKPAGTMFQWMQSDGSAGQAIVTDGAGVLGFDSFVHITGDTMTGTLTLNPAVQLNPNDACTIGQATTIATINLSWKQGVEAAQTTTLPAYTYNNGAGGVGATITANANGALPAIDGYTAVNGDRLLIWKEGGGTSSDNGIYVVTDIGSGGTPFILTRSTDTDTTTGMDKAACVPGHGTQSDHIFFQQTGSPTIGVSAISFVDTFATLYNAGAGLQLVGNTFSIAAQGIVDSMVNNAAAIAGTKISPNFGAQTVQSTGSALFQNLDITGTAGNGWIHLTAQSAAPAQPGIGSVTVYSSNNGRLGVRSGNAGPAGIGLLDFTQLGAARNYEFPNSSGIVALVPGVGFVTSNGGTLSAVAAINLTTDVTGVLPIANGGTNNSAAYTLNSIPFSNGTSLTQDNANFNYDVTTGILSAKAIKTVGTAGAGFIQLAGQNVNPFSPPAGSIKIYSDNAGRFNFLTSGGIPLTLDVSLLTTSRIQQYPDAGGIFALVPPTGVVTSNGSVLSSYARQSLRVTGTQTNTTTTPTAITNLTSTALQPGNYKFSGVIIYQSVAITTGIGLRINPGTATMSLAYGSFNIAQAASGTAHNFSYDQLTTATNVTSTGTLAANTDAIATFSGTFTVTVAGTVAMQFRSEVALSGVSIRTGSYMTIEQV